MAAGLKLIGIMFIFGVIVLGPRKADKWLEQKEQEINQEKSQDSLNSIGMKLFSVKVGKSLTGFCVRKENELFYKGCDFFLQWLKAKTDKELDENLEVLKEEVEKNESKISK